MRISLANAGKRFNREWVFRHANLHLVSGTKYAITGPNGSGKSTLLQAIGGMLQLSEGTIAYEGGGQKSEAGGMKSEIGIRNPKSEIRKLASENTYKAVSFCAPYLDVIEEMTLLEFLAFHRRFKPFLPAYTVEGIVAELGLEAAARKQIRYYSSGMKQRVKLAQALFSDTAVVLLDEPCSNLDTAGIELYHALVEKLCAERLVVVCSNDPVEYRFCNEVFSVTDFKPQRQR